MWSGLRTADSPYFSVTSQHSFGRAVDIIFKDISAEEVRQSMLKNESKWLSIYPYITLEDDVNWTHIDVRNNPEKGIRLFKP